MFVALASHGWLVTVPEPSNLGGEPQTQCLTLGVNNITVGALRISDARFSQCTNSDSDGLFVKVAATCRRT